MAFPIVVNVNMICDLWNAVECYMIDLVYPDFVVLLRFLKMTHPLRCFMIPSYEDSIVSILSGITRKPCPGAGVGVRPGSPEHSRRIRHPRQVD